MKTVDYTTVTEITGSKVTEEQLGRMYTRYRFAAELCRGKEVLEVGFGSGQGLGYLANYAKRVVGVEYDKKLLEIAQNYYRDRFELHHMDAQNLIFDNGSFDVVILYEAIYYLLEPEKFLIGAYRILRNRGTIVLCSANKDVIGFNPSPYSYRYFSANELFDLLRNYGYSGIQIYGDCRTSTDSVHDKVKSVLKRTAVKMHVMPKTMKGKELFKRFFFGELIPLPLELSGGVVEYSQPTPIRHDIPSSDYKILFALASI